MSTINPLTREQKLLAEIVIQLGNITEAITEATTTEDTTNLSNQVAHLQSQLQAVAAERAQLTAQLATSSAHVATLQDSLTQLMAGDETPDTVSQVMASLGITYDDNESTGDPGTPAQNSSY